MKKIKIFLIALLLVSVLPVAGAENIPAKADDTIAGYPTTLTSSKMEEGVDVIFQIVKPDGSKLNIPAKSGVDGKAQTELNGYHTKKAGIYKVSLSKLDKDFGSENTFKVFSDAFSPTKSKISADKSSLSAKHDNLVIRIIAKDKYENPISGQIIKLISSRLEDHIKAEGGGITDEKGVAVFDIYSDEAGVSVFTAINQTLGQEIMERSKIIFYTSEEDFSIGGNMFSANLADEEMTSFENEDFGVLDYFEIEFPNEVKVKDDSTYLTIIAKDENGNTVKNYTGTVRILVSNDDNVIIPSEGEYAFIEKDQGKKEFALAMTFTTIGQKKIEVFDYEDGQINKSIKGEKNVNVVENKDDPFDDLLNQTSEIEIKSPTDSSELSNSSITVTGLASPNTNLKLMLDDTKVAEVSVDSQGFFSTTVNDIEDGKREIQVIEIEGLNRASAPVSFFVDSTPPRVDTLTVMPEGDIKTEENYTVTAYSEPALDSVKIRINSIEETLTESAVTPGKYEGTFLAPMSPGKYSISILLVDKLGNEANYNNQAELNVIEKLVIKPDKIANVLATSGDKQIDLTWIAPNSQKEIDHYNVYVGESQYDLKIKAQVKVTNVIITNLTNDKEYFISVSAVDIDKAEGDKSNVINSKPKLFDTNCTGDSYSPTGTSPCFVCPAPYQVNSNNTVCAHAVAPTGKEKLRAISGDSKVTLTWEPYEEAVKYKVLFGIKSKKYEVELETEDNVTSYVVNDLMNKIPYYFTVVAIDERGIEISEKYNEVVEIPKGFGFKVVPSKKEIPTTILKDFSKESKIKGSTGPESITFIAVSFLIASVFFFLRKRKVVIGNMSNYSNGTRESRNNRIQF